MNENFVSFDLAKKLKERGFRYNKNNLLDRLCMENQINHPSIYQVLKWLRDSNAIFVHISIYSKGWYCDVYTYEYYEEDREYGAKHIVQLDEFSTYEEAALAGIEYALDNLI